MAQLTAIWPNVFAVSQPSRIGYDVSMAFTSQFGVVRGQEEGEVINDPQLRAKTLSFAEGARAAS